ncbi:MAG: hypothetical protein NT068_00175 [Candidatus Nomurabacteria bacterium]|nr:hypothetical protein [Candidatus Nomurabacteria bacterium]
MRSDKDKAFKLRKEGKTYRELEKLLTISRSTLSEWFKDEEWSKYIKKSNYISNVKLSTERIKDLNDKRQALLDKTYKLVEKEAEQEFEIYKNNPLFMAGLMVYAGEGDKINKHITRVSNTDFYLHRIFIDFSVKFLNIVKKDIKIALIIYGDNVESDCIDKWSKELGILKSNFYKTQVIVGKETRRKLQYGVGMSIISGKVVVKKKVVKWLELCKVNF